MNSVTETRETRAGLPQILQTGEALSMPGVLAAAAASCLAFILFLKFGLHYEFMRSDVLGYWRSSLEPFLPFDTWYLPAYPWLIALGRFVTLGLASPVLIMQCIAGFFFLASVAAVYLLAADLGVHAPGRWALLYAWYPFIGLTYSADPIADSMALGLLVLCLFCYQKRAWRWFALACAVMVLTHKATWIFALPLSMLALARHRESRMVIPFAAAPLLALLIAGAFYYHDLMWFARWSMDKLLTSRSSLPAFDGVIGPFLGGNIPKMAKGGVVLASFILALALLIASWRRRFWLGMSVAVSIVVMGVFVNQYEIWSLVRFSKVLVVPLMYVSAGSPSRADGEQHRVRSPSDLILLACLLSNAAFGYYMAKVFFS